MTGFAFLTFVLSDFGVSGVLSFSVSQLQREFGIRMAFGAGIPRKPSSGPLLKAARFCR